VNPADFAIGGTLDDAVALIERDFPTAYYGFRKCPCGRADCARPFLGAIGQAGETVGVQVNIATGETLDIGVGKWEVHAYATSPAEALRLAYGMALEQEPEE
jgi:hypothetical protein